MRSAYVRTDVTDEPTGPWFLALVALTLGSVTLARELFRLRGADGTAPDADPPTDR